VFDVSTVRSAGIALVAAQFVGMLVFSAVQYGRYSLTSDYAFYASALYQIAHLHVSAYFFMNHGELTFYLLAPTYWLAPHGPMLLWDQDLAVVGAELVAFLWICDLAAERRIGSPRLGALVALSGLLALLLDPWIWWTLAFDFHFETVGALFAVLFARDLFRGRRTAWLWAALTIFSGDVETTYVIAIAAGALLVSRPRWRPLVISAGALAWFAVLHGTGAMRGAGNLAAVASVAAVAGKHVSNSRSIGGLGELGVGLLRQPARVLATVRAQWLNTWANLAASGPVGVLSPALVFVPLLVTVENALYGQTFSEPSFQSIAIYLFMPVATVMVLVWLARRRPRLAGVLAVLVAADVLGWGLVWLPRTASQWIRVPPAAAAQLDRVSAALPPTAEVVASQGIGGRFAPGRPYVGMVGPAGKVSIFSRDVWFIVAPSVGIETAPSSSQEALIGELAGPLHAQPVVVGDGIWAFRYRPPKGQTSLTLPGVPTTLPAWLFGSTSGGKMETGPARDWHMAGGVTPGYAVWGDYWMLGQGRATASAVVSGAGLVDVEVWDVTTNTLLARRQVVLQAQRTVERFSVVVPRPRAAAPFQGFGPFSSRPTAPSSDQLEVRVYTPGGTTTVNVYEVGLAR
jgi:hypothetical protein